MVIIGESTDAQPLTDRMLFKVIGKSISLQCKCTDSGSRPNLFVQNYALMYYFLRFFRKGTRHNIVGALNAYAYTNEDDSRAFINLRINVIAVRPYVNVGDDDVIIPSEAIRMHADNYDNDKMVKLKYLLFKYVWQNIRDERFVKQEKLVTEPLAHLLSDLHDELCEDGIIINGENLNPVLVTERVLKKKRTGSNLSERKRDVEYTFNPRVPKVDWDDLDLSFNDLMSTRTPFPESMTAVPVTIDEEEF